MEEAEFYCFHDLGLEVRSESPGFREHLCRLLQSLSWVRASPFEKRRALRLCVSTNPDGVALPSAGHVCFRADEFFGVESGDEFYLSDGSSSFHLQPAKGRGDASLAPSFFSKSLFLQQSFWTFGLLKLLRHIKMYSLHAAGLDKDGRGLLLVGPSGSGKTTLSIGLVRAGWSYLSDDAVLLRSAADGVDALSLRRNFYVDASGAGDYSDLRLGKKTRRSRNSDREKRRASIDESYPGRYASRCMPVSLVFPRIVAREQSELLPMDQVRALKILLVESSPELFDTSTMGGHLAVLKKLLGQTRAYELNAGADLRRDPAKLLELLEEVDGGERWRG
jgi:hypothetical protein